MRITSESLHFSAASKTSQMGKADSWGKWEALQFVRVNGFIPSPAKYVISKIFVNLKL